jgi:hypothetical protein
MGHHHLGFDDLPKGGEMLELARVKKASSLFAGLALIGAIGTVVFWTKDSAAFAYSWLFAVFTAFTVTCGGLFWMMLHAATNSGWGVAVRRIWEHLANMILPLAILALPLAFPKVQTHLYEWMNHERAAVAKYSGVDHHDDHGSKGGHHDHDHAGHQDHTMSAAEALHHAAEEDPHMHVLAGKSGYLNTGFWYFRFFAYFVIIFYVATRLRGKSVAQDLDGNLKHTISARGLSCRWLLFVALTITFAAIDWVMALDYAWFSTMWGVYIFAGCAWSAMALSIIILTWLRSVGYLSKVVSDEHYHLMGKLLFAFTVFWAYIAFSQYFLIWYANITEETRFYLTRNTESWRLVSIFIVIGHFIGPFVALLSQDRKKKPKVMVFLCLWVLLMHLVDMYWNIIPERGPSLGRGWWVDGAWMGDIAALLLVVGILGLWYIRSLARASLYPCRDPRLLESVNVLN